MTTQEALEKLSEYQNQIAESIGTLTKIVSGLIDRIEKLERSK